MKIKDQRGQAMIEACLATLIILMTLVSFSLLSYRGFVYYYCDYQLYEALICTQHSSATACQNELRQKISKVLIFGKLDSFKIDQSKFMAKGAVIVQFPKVLQFVSPHLEVRNSIKLPLKRTRG